MDSWMSSFVRNELTTEGDTDNNPATGGEHDHELGPKLGHRRLGELCLPGTHNSHAYMTRNRLLLAPLVRGWVLCQSHDVLQQLESGVRLLDLRVWPDESNLRQSGSIDGTDNREEQGDVSKSMDDNATDGWFGHGIAKTSPVSCLVRDVLDFASSHPTEVIICVAKYCRPLHDIHVDVVSVLERALHRQMPSFHPVTLHGPKALDELTALRAQTIGNLTCDGARAAILVTSWDHWNGSWNVTKENNPQLLRRKAASWTRSLPDQTTIRKDVTTSATTATTSSNAPLRRHCHPQDSPNVLEYVITVDEGQDSSTWSVWRLLLTHSVRSLARQLNRTSTDGATTNTSNSQSTGSQQQTETCGISFTSSILLSKLQGVLFDYPTPEQIRGVVAFNLATSSL